MNSQLVLVELTQQELTTIEGGFWKELGFGIGVVAGFLAYPIVAAYEAGEADACKC